MLRVLACLPAHVLRVSVFNMLACFVSLRAQMSYMLAVLGILVFPICFRFEKLNFKNVPLFREVFRTSKKEFFY